jgi:hypothetical protein
MHCLECGAQYDGDVTTCPDCRLPLIRDLPPLPVPDYVGYEEILGTFNAGNIAIIKSILDAEDITYYFQGEFFNYAGPLVQPARLMVRKDQAREAREILEDLRISYSLSGERDNPEDDE